MPKNLPINSTHFERLMHASQFIWVWELHGIWNCIHRSSIKQSVINLDHGLAQLIQHKKFGFEENSIIYSVQISTWSMLTNRIQFECVWACRREIRTQNHTKMTNENLENRKPYAWNGSEYKVVFNFIGHGLLKIKWCVELWLQHHVNLRNILFFVSFHFERDAIIVKGCSKFNSN